MKLVVSSEDHPACAHPRTNSRDHHPLESALGRLRRCLWTVLCPRILVMLSYGHRAAAERSRGEIREHPPKEVLASPCQQQLLKVSSSPMPQTHTHCRDGVACLASGPLSSRWHPLARMSMWRYGPTLRRKVRQAWLPRVLEERCGSYGTSLATSPHIQLTHHHFPRCFP